MTQQEFPERLKTLAPELAWSQLSGHWTRVVWDLAVGNFKTVTVTDPNGEDYEYDTVEQVEKLEEADLVTSLITRLRTLPGPTLSDVMAAPDSTAARGARHKILLDINHRALLLPSSTEGHHHLYIDVDVAWYKVLNLLRALEDCGIVEAGYASASKARGFTCLRMPWTEKKPQQQDEMERIQ